MPATPFLVLGGAFLFLALLVAASIVRTYGRARLAPRATVDLEPDGEPPYEALAHFDLVGNAMEICGFHVEHEVGRMDGTEGDLEGWFRSWVDAAGTTRGVASVLVPRSTRASEVTQVSFRSRATIAGERREVETNDAPTTAPWRLPSRQSVRLPGGTPETLWHIHRARLGTLPAGSVHPLPEDLASELVRAHRDMVEEGLRREYLQTAEDGRLRYTRAGGWTAAKAQLPPWTTRRDHADRRAADEWLVNG